MRVAGPIMGNLEIPPDDGFTWRKYGQKEILGSSFPRYFQDSYDLPRILYLQDDFDNQFPRSNLVMSSFYATEVTTDALTRAFTAVKQRSKYRDWMTTLIHLK